MQPSTPRADEPVLERTQLMSAVGGSAVGARLADGRYSLERELRPGASFQVFLARDHLLARPVVVKLADCGDATFAAVFKRVALLAARLIHPNIVAVYDWGEEDGRCYAVAEYLPGPTLDDVLRRQGGMPEVQALGIAEQVADAIEAAHAQGLVHGGLCPRAIFFDARGHVRVNDFGSAVGESADAAAYIAPEAAAGRPADERTDIYGLGAVIAAMLGGRPSSRGWPRVSAATEPILARTLAADPDERYPDAVALREALRGARASLLAPTGGGGRWAVTTPTAGGSWSVTGGTGSPGAAPWRALAAMLARLPAGLARIVPGWWIAAAGVLAVVLLLLFVPPANRLVAAGQSAGRSAGAQLGATPPTAAGSSQPAGCRFTMGFKQLHDKIPTLVGNCAENERWVPERNETVQRTTRGLLVWRKADGVAAFTDGYRTWLDGPLGLQQRLNTERFNWEAR